MAPELFVVKCGPEYILHLPLHRVSLRVNRAALEVIQSVSRGEHHHDDEPIISDLLSAGVLSHTDEQPPELSPTPVVVRPGHLTIFPTTDCNLRCTYCYGNAGKDCTTIEREVAEAAIDRTISMVLNSPSTASKQVGVRLSFHGAGEPLLWTNWELVTGIVDYARSRSAAHRLPFRFVTATNGVLNLSQLEWLRVNVDSVQISLDGPEDIQNAQRSLSDGRGLFD